MDLRKNSVFQGIVSSLREKILSGKWQDGFQIPSEMELAKEFSTSQSTVRKALLMLKQEQLLDSKQGRGNFVRRSDGRKDAIAVILYDLDYLNWPATAQRISGIKERLVALKCNLALLAFNGDAGRRANQPGPYKWNGILDPQTVDGAIILVHETDERSVKELSAYLPLVMIDRPPLGDKTISVCEDFTNGAFKAAKHLIEYGHRDIALVTVGTEQPIGNQQRAGARIAAMETPGADIRNVMTGGFLAKDGRKAVAELLASGKRPSAIIAGSDELAVGIYQGLKDAGMKMPDDMSLVRWNDLLTEKDLPVAMTSVKMDFTETGRRAVDRLMDLLAGRPVEKETFIYPDLVVRKSTARLSNRKKGDAYGKASL